MTHHVVDRVGPGLFKAGVTLLWMYVCVALLFGTALLGITINLPILALLSLLGYAAAAGISRVRAIPNARLFDVGIVTLVLVAMLVAGDVALAARDNWTRARAEAPMAESVRLRDSQIWQGELFPRIYFPSGQSFALYKPNTRIRAQAFGGVYLSAMSRSPRLASMLEPRQVSYAIGPEGLRETESLAESRIFVLGDSFAFGYSTDEGKVWPDVLGASLGEPVYNLGLSGTGPQQQLDLLRYMLKTHSDSMHVKQLLWMIFEGNDLEDSYTAPQAVSPPGRLATALKGTTVEPLLSLPLIVREGSAVRKLLHGELTILPSPQAYGQYHVDGVDLPYPLFVSSRFGDRIFYPVNIDPATKPRDYVMNHPNRVKLERTFHEMRELSERLRFTVTVVIAPSDARLYGPAYEGFPPVSEPHFIRYVEQLATGMGFPTINLLPLLQPMAERELIYYRDDDHWNVRGNAVVAQLLATYVRKTDVSTR